MQQLERRRDRWVSAGLSVLLHGAIIGALIFGWWSFRHPAPAPPSTLAIDATVVSSKSLKGGTAALEHRAPPPTPPLQTVTPSAHSAEPQTVTPPPPPQPTPPPSLSDDQTVPPPPQEKPVDHKAEAEAQRKAAERKAQQLAEQRAADEAAAERKAKQAEAKKRAEQQRLAEAKRKAEEQRKAEQQRKLEAARKADEERRAAEAKQLALNQAQLAQGVDAEEKLLAERTGPAMATWAQLIQARIQHAWIRPPTARPGIDCFIDITQVPGGEVTDVKVGACNGDQAVRQSIQDAAYRASPLPQPSDPALFERVIRVEFKPTE